VGLCPELSQWLLGTPVFVRKVIHSRDQLVTVSLTVSVRSLGFTDTGKKTSFRSAERQIIDHQVQRYRVLKQLSLAYAIKFTGAYMVDKFKDLGSDTSSLIQDTSALPEIAATSSGLKALCTYLTSQVLGSHFS